MREVLEVQERLLIEILNEVENDKPITWAEANRLRLFQENFEKKYGTEKLINWSKVKLI